MRDPGQITLTAYELLKFTFSVDLRAKWKFFIMRQAGELNSPPPSVGIWLVFAANGQTPGHAATV